jgi:outer membrane protein insertion porin family
LPKSGIKRTYLGLAIGILVGLSIIIVQDILANQLVSLLQEEIQASTSCDFAVDDIHVSILTLSAEAHNARIQCPSRTPLLFKSLSADFSIANIRQHHVDLSLLVLSNGFADGIGPDSDTFKFLDHLLSPGKPEDDYPGKWKLKLERLHIENWAFREPIAIGDILAKNVTVSVHRTPDNNFELVPAIPELEFLPNNEELNNSIKLGKVSGKVPITDEAIRLENIRLTKDNSWLTLNANNYNIDDSVDGTIQFFCDKDGRYIRSYLQTALDGDAKISGKLERPLVTGQAKNNGLVYPQLFDLGFPSLEKLESTYSLSIGRSSVLEVSSAKISGLNGFIEAKRPIIIQKGEVTGALYANLKYIDIGHNRFENVSGDIELKGNFSDPDTKIKANIKRSIMFGASFPEMEGDINYSNGLLDINLKNKDPALGSLTTTGTFSFKEEGPAKIIEKFNVVAKNYNWMKGLGAESVPVAFPQIMNGDFVLSGEVSATGIKTSGNYKLTSLLPTQLNTYSGNTKIDNSLLEVLITDSKKSAEFKISSNLNTKDSGKASIDLNNFNLQDLFEHLPCGSTNLIFNYTFDNDSPFQGNGLINVKRLELACAPYQMTLLQPKELKLTNGKLYIDKLLIKGNDSSLFMSGSLENFLIANLSLDGELQAKTLLTLFPTLDELKGHIEALASINGDIRSPVIEGTAKLIEGTVDIESANVGAQNIAGEFLLKEKKINLASLKGDLNDGSFSVEGYIDPLNIAHSEVVVKVDNILFAPTNEVNMTISSEIKLQRLETGQPGLKGIINITNAEFQRNIDIRSIIRELPALLLSKQEVTDNLKSLPNLDLDIQVVASHNIFVLTNFFNSELSSNLQVTGNLQQPTVRGDMDIISGWLGFKDRRFEINSGKINFKQGSFEPILDLSSEAYVQSPLGENILIILEAKGQLLNPKVELSSDRGLSDRELLQIITAGSSFTRESEINSLKSDFEFGGSDNEDDDDALIPLGRIVQNLADIDSISIEPSYNSQTGSVDPAIIIRKRLFDRLSIEGERFFTTSDSLSKAQAIYNISQRLNLLGSIESSTNKPEAALEVGLTYTILSSQKKFLKTLLNGGENINSSALLKALRINDNTRIPCNEYQQVTHSAIKFYQERGYLNAKVVTEPVCEQELIRQLNFNVTEGSRVAINNILFDGDLLPSNIDTTLLKKKDSSQHATQYFLNKKVSQITKVLRSEGYIAARVHAKYDEPSNDSTNLTITINLGNPVSFSFQGNTVFSAADFLNTINLFDRKIPLGNNTINLLVAAIERLYRQKGYLYATVSYEKLEESELGRINYLITINEENKISVSSVIFKGNVNLPEAVIKERIYSSYKPFAEIMLKPQVASDEQIKTNIAILKELYEQEGFSNTEITYNIEPDDSEKSVKIIYTITEGDTVRAKDIIVHGLPVSVATPLLPKQPYSIYTTNLYLELLHNTLKEAGYFHSSLNAYYDSNTENMIITIEPGEISKILAIEYQGNIKVSTEVISKQILVKPGDAWNTEKLLESKRKLLKLGLFSRVEMLAKDNNVDSINEILLVKVDERALRSLEVGSGANSTYGARIFAIATDKQTFADGKSISLISDIYYDPRESGISQGVAGVTYSHPDLFDSSLTLTEDVRYQKFEISTQEFDLDRASIASYLYKNWGEGTTFTIGHTLQDENLDNVSPGAIMSPLDEGAVKLSFLSGVLVYDQRETPLTQSKGLATSFDYKLSSKSLLSDADFLSIGGRLSYVEPIEAISNRFSLAFNTHLASSWTFSGTQQVPISQRYYLGGRTTIRGFKENSLGPRALDGSVIGGDLLVANNFEARYLIINDVSLITFLDAGTVFLRDIGVSGNDIRYSTGIGIRYLSPIGPIGFDLGHPLDRMSGESSLRFHFAIGNNF